MADLEDLDNLKRRLSKLEALVATLFVVDLPQNYTPFIEDFLYFLKLEAPFDKELSILLRKIMKQKELSPRSVKSDSRLREIEIRLKELNETNYRFQDSLKYSDRLAYDTSVLRSEVSKLSEDHKRLQQESHSYFYVHSLGLELAQVALPRFIPVRVYLSSSEPDQIDQVSTAIQGVLDAFDFTISDDFPAESGSWWKSWFARTKAVATQPEVLDRLAKIERAVDLQGLHKPQSEIDKNQAEAIATLVKALEHTPNSAVQAGSILLVKVTGNDGNCSIQSRVMTQKEMIFLESNQKLLGSPKTILKKMSDHCGVKQINSSS